MLPKNNNLGKYHKINQNGLFWYFSQLDTKHSILGKRITEQMYKHFTVYFFISCQIHVNGAKLHVVKWSD